MAEQNRCNECGQTFNSSNELRDIRRRVTREVPGRRDRRVRRDRSKKREETNKKGPETNSISGLFYCVSLGGNGARPFRSERLLIDRGCQVAEFLVRFFLFFQRLSQQGDCLVFAEELGVFPHATVGADL